MIFDSSTFQDEKFSWKAAYCLAHASYLAYHEDQEQVKSEFCMALPDAIEVQPFAVATTEGVLVEKEKALILTFRGTKGRADWVYNFKTRQIRSWFEYPGKVHSGFHEALNHVWKTVVGPAIDSAYRDNKKIYLAGHSLGGALCILTAARIAKKYRADLVGGIYTYGQPKVGNQAFVNYFKKHFADQYFRFVYNKDIVARIPPKGYEHCGNLYHFGEDGELQQTRGMFESIIGEEELTEEEFTRFQIEMLADDVRADIAATRNSDLESMPSPSQVFGVEDHSLIYKYLPAIREMYEQEGQGEGPLSETDFT
ncbi:MAG: lipase family protein [Verrucomicrobiales bacterium]|nr:lipase family protein [Verrucomicrobiales bacterium]